MVVFNGRLLSRWERGSSAPLPWRRRQAWHSFGSSQWQAVYQTPGQRL